MKLLAIAGLVVAGLVLGALRPGMLTEAFRTATLYVFLPALIFEGAWNLDFTLMRRGWRPILLLAVPGVVVTASVIALLVHLFGSMGVASALLVGAVLSATDPVAVVAIFRQLEIPAALATIVESEALLNDAIAVVLYRSVVASVVGSAAVSRIGQISLGAVIGAFAGIGLGAAIGLLCALAFRGRLGVVLQWATTFVAAYVAYFLAERWTWSGIFAVITCAIVMREMERRHHSITLAGGVERVWGVTAIVANALLFFLVGAAVAPSHLWAERAFLLLTLGAVLLARFLLAYGLLGLLPRMRRSWKSVVRLAGVRGALSLALALAIPAGFPDRGLIIDATFVVVIVTVLIGSLTAERRVAGLDLG